jgi:hypothetical protein
MSEESPTAGEDTRDVAGERVLIIDDAFPAVRDARGGRDLIEAALNAGATLIAVPAARLDAEFFRLRSGLAGEILQKAANYRLKFAVIGDIAEHIAASDALRDFVIECNRGREIFFVADVTELEQRLSTK